MEQSTYPVSKERTVSVVQDYFNALKAGDIGKLGAIFASDIIWHQPGESKLSGTYQGRDDVIDLLERFMEISGGTFQIDDVKAIMINGDLVSVLLHFKAEQPGRKMAMSGVDLFRIEDGTIKEVWLFSADPVAEDRFWGY